jgi:hypothetical protein
MDLELFCWKEAVTAFYPSRYSWPLYTLHMSPIILTVQSVHMSPTEAPDANEDAAAAMKQLKQFLNSFSPMFIMFPRAQSRNKEVTVYFRDFAACKIIRSPPISSYSITHLQPAVPSSPSLPLANALLLDASSSSTMSWGLTVICTTFAASALNLQSTRKPG